MRSHTARWAFQPGRRSRQRDTGVGCPSCGGATLIAHVGCLETTFRCPICERRYALPDLLERLQDDAAARLANSIDDRPSDRL